MAAAFGPLVETAWLRAHLGDPGVVVVDCRYVLGRPGAGRPKWLDGHIPGAAFLDVDRDLAAEPGERGRHPLPEAADFEAAARGAGIESNSRVVAYDEAGEGGAVRLWWLLRHFGHDEAAVLNGGLAAWREEGGPLEEGEGEGKLEAGEAEADPEAGEAEAEPEAGEAEAEPEAGEAEAEPEEGEAAAGPGSATAKHPFTAKPREDDTVSADELGSEVSADELGSVVSADELGSEASADRPGRARLLDARAPERYRGETEPIDPVAGHIPGAVNVFFAEIAPKGRFLPHAELRERLGDEPFVAYCGSGITACTLVLAGELAGVEGRLYPGSWSEWCRR